MSGARRWLQKLLKPLPRKGHGPRRSSLKGDEPRLPTSPSASAPVAKQLRMAPFAEWIEFDQEVPAHLARQHWNRRPAYDSEDYEDAVECSSAPPSTRSGSGLWSPHASAVTIDMGFFMRQTSGTSGSSDAEETLPNAVPEDGGGADGDASFLRQATEDSEIAELLPPGAVPEESEETERSRPCSKEEVAREAAAEPQALRSLAQARERAFDDIPSLPCLVACKKPEQDTLTIENAIGIW